MPYGTRLCGTRVHCNVLLEFKTLKYHVRTVPNSHSTHTVNNCGCGFLFFLSFVKVMWEKVVKKVAKEFETQAISFISQRTRVSSELFKELNFRKLEFHFELEFYKLEFETKYFIKHQ